MDEKVEKGRGRGVGGGMGEGGGERGRGGGGGGRRGLKYLSKHKDKACLTTFLDALTF